MDFFTYCCFEPRLYDDMVLSITSFGMRVKNSKGTSYPFQSYAFIRDRPTMFVNMNIEQPLGLIPTGRRFKPPSPLRADFF
jgi:hypothetical protein